MIANGDSAPRSQEQNLNALAGEFSELFKLIGDAVAGITDADVEDQLRLVLGQVDQPGPSPSRADFLMPSVEVPSSLRDLFGLTDAREGDQSWSERAVISGGARNRAVSKVSAPVPAAVLARRAHRKHHKFLTSTSLTVSAALLITAIVAGAVHPEDGTRTLKPRSADTISVSGEVQLNGSVAAVGFPRSGSVLESSAVEVLDSLVGMKWLRTERLEIVGYADGPGVTRYNQGLARDRAQAVARYLEVHGFRLDRLLVRGFTPERSWVGWKSSYGRVVITALGLGADVSQFMPSPAHDYPTPRP